MEQSEVAMAHAQLSARQLAEGAHGPALESIASALSLAPGLAPLWAQFSDVIRYFNLRHPVPAPVRELLSKALEHPAVDPGDLVRPVTTLALSRPHPFEEPLLLRLLEDVVIRDAQLERLITDTRRRMLEEKMPLALMTAIAHQCFNAQYVFEETEAERTQLAALRERILAAQSVSEHWCAAYAAYRPLHSLPGKTLPIESLVRRQIREPEEERRLAADIASLSAARTAVSAKVQAQYEANPYPRWLRAPAAGGQAPQGISGKPRILVAGCGTGQHAIATAQQYPAASVLAVDLSMASLAYAKRKTLERGLTQIEYRQADILALDGLQQRFDLIECSGVLHHLEDPFEGWRLLRNLLNPGAFMRVGLYSESGRRAVVRARELIATEGFAPDAAGIRACRAAIRARSGDALLATLARNEDFFSMSGCRDLLFHVQEHRFSLPQIEAMIGRLGLRFLGFEFPDSGAMLARYRERFQDPLDLKSWHRFEMEFPDAFSRMYQFWVS
jgi:2-polyprenyl-3-methyl-5-hydroxy-6-metoxy-1,4-benzoquinol methylase